MEITQEAAGREYFAVKKWKTTLEPAAKTLLSGALLRHFGGTQDSNYPFTLQQRPFTKTLSIERVTLSIGVRDVDCYSLIVRDGSHEVLGCVPLSEASGVHTSVLNANVSVARNIPWKPESATPKRSLFVNPKKPIKVATALASYENLVSVVARVSAVAAHVLDCIDRAESLSVVVLSDWEEIRLVVEFLRFWTREVPAIIWWEKCSHSCVNVFCYESLKPRAASLRQVSIVLAPCDAVVLDEAECSACASVLELEPIQSELAERILRGKRRGATSAALIHVKSISVTP